MSSKVDFDPVTKKKTITERRKECELKANVNKVCCDVLAAGTSRVNMICCCYGLQRFHFNALQLERVKLWQLVLVIVKTFSALIQEA